MASDYRHAAPGDRLITEDQIGWLIDYLNEMPTHHADITPVSVLRSLPKPTKVDHHGLDEPEEGDDG